MGLGESDLATYKQIQEWVAQKYGVAVKTCWIAEVKNIHGLTRGPAHNREGPERKHPCPIKYWDMIEDALRHFGMIN